MARRATRGDSAQFTYDFGIAIAQSTVNKVARLTGVTLSLASAFYALKTTATEYVDILRENTLRFGGMLSTMKAMQQAQDRLITGMSGSDVRDQLEGMNRLMAAGISVKENMAWIEKAANATGKSFAEFSGMISSAVQGNLQGLVDAGLMTQRATKAFTKFQGNTKMMQGAVMNFLRTHKGLMSAIKNDFTTIEDGVNRLKAVMTSFLQSIIGKPNDPDSLYGSVARVFNMIADKFGKDGVLSQNMIMLRQYGEGVGIVMSWTVRKIGEVMVWLGRQAKKATMWLLGSSETFAERMRSLVVWLEFWKLKIVDFFKEYSGAIKGVFKLLIAYQALKWVFVISQVAINSVWAFYKAIKATYQLQLAYIAFQGPLISKTARVFQSLAVWMPQPFRRAWVASGKYLGLMFAGCVGWANKVVAVFKGVGLAMVAPFRMAAKVIPGLLNVIISAMAIPFYGFLALIQRGFGRKRMLVLMRHFIGYFKQGISQIATGLGYIFKPLWNFFKGFFKYLKGGFKFIVNMIMNLPKLIGSLFRSLRAMWVALSAMNPMGWVLLAIALVTTLYVKCRTFRVFINSLFKFIWESIKIAWNLIYGAFLYVYVGCKKAWQFLKNYIFVPIANFFKKAWGWIKDMWKAFMNTAVGRFIDKYIVSPIKSLFDWMLKAWNWIVKAMAKAVEWIAGANSDLAKSLNEMAKQNGLPQLAIAGGTYNTNDDTNYLNPKNWGIGDMMPKGVGNEPQTPKNPLLSEPSGNSGNGGGGTTNNISLSNGAVQIIVPKGTDIDEEKLARMVRDEIRNLDRENRMRGGDI